MSYLAMNTQPIVTPAVWPSRPPRGKDCARDQAGREETLRCFLVRELMHTRTQAEQEVVSGFLLDLQAALTRIG